MGEETKTHGELVAAGLRDECDLRGLISQSHNCIDCGYNTQPGCPNRAEAEQIIIARCSILRDRSRPGRSPRLLVMNRSSPNRGSPPAGMRSPRSTGSRCGSKSGAPPRSVGAVFAFGN
jgi:hypothetical protein